MKYRLQSGPSSDLYRVKISKDNNDDQVRIQLIYRILPTVLADQGIWVLHASGIAIRKKAFLFVGTSRAGKSTAAYALSLREKYNFIGDEAIALRYIRGKVLVYSYPQALRLRAHAMRAVKGNSASKIGHLIVDQKHHIAMNAIAEIFNGPYNLSKILILIGSDKKNQKSSSAAPLIHYLLKSTYLPVWKNNKPELAIFNTMVEVLKRGLVICYQNKKNKKSLKEIRKIISA